MLCLNGAFGLFAKLPELVQTLLVACSLFGFGLSAGLLFHNYKGLPAVVNEQGKQIEVLDSAVNHISTRQEHIALNFPAINKSLQQIETSINGMSWRIEVLSCYQEDREDRRNCLESARDSVLILQNPPTSSGGDNE